MSVSMNELTYCCNLYAIAYTACIFSCFCFILKKNENSHLILLFHIYLWFVNFYYARPHVLKVWLGACKGIHVFKVWLGACKGIHVFKVWLGACKGIHVFKVWLGHVRAHMSSKCGWGHARAYMSSKCGWGHARAYMS